MEPVACESAFYYRSWTVRSAWAVIETRRHLNESVIGIWSTSWIISQPHGSGSVRFDATCADEMHLGTLL